MTHSNIDPASICQRASRFMVTCLVAVIALVLRSPIVYAEKPPVNEKFVVYGGSKATIDAELKGRVVAFWATMIYIVPDSNYDHLLIEGNRRRPDAGENYKEAWEWYRDNILPETGPIIKVEADPIPGIQKGSDRLPEVLENGVWRTVRKGDHVKLTGLYAVDYSHSMFYKLHTSSTTSKRGLYRAGVAHAEIHPYNHPWELVSSAQANSEIHLVGAPIYSQIYTGTWWWNKKMGVAGDFVDEKKETMKVAQFFIPAPPRLGPDFEPHLVVSEVLEGGEGTASVTSSRTDAGVRVTVTVRGSKASNPRIHRARYTVEWGPKTSSPPPP